MAGDMMLVLYAGRKREGDMLAGGNKWQDFKLRHFLNRRSVTLAL
jgi:hypothetical protein